MAQASAVCRWQMHKPSWRMLCKPEMREKPQNYVNYIVNWCKLQSIRHRASWSMWRNHFRSPVWLRPYTPGCRNICQCQKNYQLCQKYPKTGCQKLYQKRLILGTEVMSTQPALSQSTACAHAFSVKLTRLCKVNPFWANHHVHTTKHGFAIVLPHLYFEIAEHQGHTTSNLKTLDITRRVDSTYLPSMSGHHWMKQVKRLGFLRCPSWFGGRFNSFRSVLLFYKASAAIGGVPCI